MGMGKNFLKRWGYFEGWRQGAEEYPHGPDNIPSLGVVWNLHSTSNVVFSPFNYSLTFELK